MSILRYVDQCGFRVHRVPRLTMGKCAIIREDVRQATILHWGPFTPTSRFIHMRKGL
jgi:hypothetical protein